MWWKSRKERNHSISLVIDDPPHSGKSARQPSGDVPCSSRGPILPMRWAAYGLATGAPVDVV